MYEEEAYEEEMLDAEARRCHLSAASRRCTAVALDRDEKVGSHPDVLVALPLFSEMPQGQILYNPFDLCLA